MFRLVRLALVCLLALALPLQGMAGALRAHCQAGTGGTGHAHHAAAEHAAALQAHEVAAPDDHEHHHGELGHAGHDEGPQGVVQHEAGTPESSAGCSACAACCAATALPAEVPLWTMPLPHASPRPSACGLGVVFLTSGPERPPRILRA